MPTLSPTPLTPTQRYIPAGVRRILSVPTIANPASPTLAELNAGTELTAEITADGIEGFTTSSDDAEVPDYGSDTTGKIPGMKSLDDASLKLYASKTSADSRGTLTDGLATNIVIFPEGWALATNKMNVFVSRVKNTNVLNDAAGEPAAVQHQFSIQKVIKNITVPSA